MGACSTKHTATMKRYTFHGPSSPTCWLEYSTRSEICPPTTAPAQSRLELTGVPLPCLKEHPSSTALAPKNGVRHVCRMGGAPWRLSVVEVLVSATYLYIAVGSAYGARVAF